MTRKRIGVNVQKKWCNSRNAWMINGKLEQPRNSIVVSVKGILNLNSKKSSNLHYSNYNF